MQEALVRSWVSILRVFSVKAGVMWILARVAGGSENQSRQPTYLFHRQYRGCVPPSRCAATSGLYSSLRLIWTFALSGKSSNLLSRTHSSKSSSYTSTMTSHCEPNSSEAAVSTDTSSSSAGFVATYWQCKLLLNGCAQRLQGACRYRAFALLWQ